jgi:hypothetical protein
LEEQETLESIFLTRGYEIVRSSRENRYLLLKKEGSAMAVGYSMSSKKTTEGEAEMFISMGQNDSAGSMLFISPIKLSRAVKNILEKEGVATWDRMALSIAIGEQVLSEWSREVDRGSETRSVMDLFETQDVDPLREVRTYQKEISKSEVGGFKVTEVEVAPSIGASGKEDAVRIVAPVLPSPPPDKKESPAEVEKGSETPSPAPEFDLPMMPMMEMSADEPPAEEDIGEGAGSHKVPEDILMGPLTDLEDESDKKIDVEEEKPTSGIEKKKPSGWEGATMAPVKYSQGDAVSLAGEKRNVKLKKMNKPFLILEASYTMTPEDGSDPVEQDGTYIYDCIRSDISDIPGSLYDEIAAMEERWNGEEGPDKLTDPKEDHRSAMMAIKNRIRSGRLAKDRKVRETLMSTIYREIEYKFDPSSLKLISSRRVMLPFWIKEGKSGKTAWSVNAFLGRLIK